jgi:hypothetical protein
MRLKLSTRVLPSPMLLFPVLCLLPLFAAHPNPECVLLPEEY